MKAAIEGVMFIEVWRSSDLLIRDPSVLYPHGSFALYHNNFELLLEFFQQIQLKHWGSQLKCHYDQIFNLLIFLCVLHRILWKNENAVYLLQIPALVSEIFKFEKCVKYANEMTDDVIHSTQ